MKTCHENDKLLLFCERGLSEVEQAEFELHLKSCPECSKEVAEINADDALLKEGIAEAFARHRVNNRIMQQIRSEKIIPAQTGKPAQHSWRYFWLSALALLAIIAAANLYTPAAVKYHGQSQGVMVQALNDSAILQGEHMTADQSVKLEALKPIALDGCFLFTVTNGHTSVFKMSGKATVRLSNGQPDFSDSEAVFEFISGAQLTIIVNQQPMQLERKKQSAAAVSTSEIDKPLIRTATTAAELNVIVEGKEEAVPILKPAENASAACNTPQEVTSSESWIDPALAPMKNPFADEPIELNGN
ncbi:MAG: zf-HC2 domain-containing protein [Candidatus Riflebacteria bacterium]|nr:zf-HC2 domain-containing protein [Candidatus Riflebacteria bacterium]